MPEFKYNDGGKDTEGYNERSTGSCFVRAIAISSYMKFADAWKMVEFVCCTDKDSDPGSGVHPKVAIPLLEALGWRRKPTWSHKTIDNAPLSKYYKSIVLLEYPQHIATLKFGVLNDTHICGKEITAIWHKQGENYENVQD